LQIPAMTRSDVKTLISLGPLAALLAFGWMFRGSPCLAIMALALTMAFTVTSKRRPHG